MDDLRTDDALDAELVIQAQGGDRGAAEHLLRRHQSWVLHVAQRMLWNRADAEDATQEILLKAVTKLDSFQGRSSFRTWLYRIAANHLLDHCRSAKAFDQVARGLDEIPDEDLPVGGVGGIERAVLVEEAKIACTTAILLCLKPRQRLAFILGEVLGVDDEIGSAILDTSAANFRQMLSRARRELYGFLNRQCGLVNRRNPCRCEKKATGFISKGWVHPEKLQFVDTRLVEIQRCAPDRTRELHELEQQHARIFREEPLLAPREQAARLRKLLEFTPMHGDLGLNPNPKAENSAS